MRRISAQRLFTPPGKFSLFAGELKIPFLQITLTGQPHSKPYIEWEAPIPSAVGRIAGTFHKTADNDPGISGKSGIQYLPRLHRHPLDATIDDVPRQRFPAK